MSSGVCQQTTGLRQNRSLLQEIQGVQLHSDVQHQSELRLGAELHAVAADHVCLKCFE